MRDHLQTRPDRQGVGHGEHGRPKREKDRALIGNRQRDRSRKRSLCASVVRPPSVVTGIGDTGWNRSASVMANHLALVGQHVQIKPNGLRRDPEMLGQGLDRKIAAATDQIDDLLPSRARRERFIQAESPE
jgi:hypothetical protein